MTVTEWLTENWQLVSTVINAILLILILGGRSRLKDTEAKATKAQSELEDTRNQGATTAAILRLLEGQLVNTARLAQAIEERNELQKQDSEQHSKVVDGVLANNARVVELITSFQSYSKAQHEQTRSDIGGKVDSVAQNVQAGRDDFAQFKRDLNGRFKQLAPSLQNRFESGERNLDAAISKMPDTDKLNPANVPDSDPSKPTPPADPSSTDSAA